MGRAPTDTKDKLIATAIELIWRHSYSSVSVDDICRAAGAKKGSFYHYFPSKLDLAVAAMETSFAEATPIYNDIFSPLRSPLERYEKLVEHKIARQEEALQQYGQVCGCPFASIGAEMAGQEEQLRGKSHSICQQILRYHENALRDLIAEGRLPADCDVKAKAEEIFAYMLGQLTMARMQNSLDGLKKNLRHGIFQVIGISDHSATQNKEAFRAGS